MKIKSRPRVIVFETHPVQYKAPVYRIVSELGFIDLVVVYASDFSVTGANVDREFGRVVNWDLPLLEGYELRILNTDRVDNSSGIRTFGGRGVVKCIQELKPDVIVLTSSRYRFDFFAFFAAIVLRVPICIRQETQDEMFALSRGKVKSAFRYLFYRAYYSFASGAIAFGELNRRHLVKHGFNQSELGMARFSVVDAFQGLSTLQLDAMRRETRKGLGIDDGATVISFFGKLINKKNPKALLEAIPLVCGIERMKISVLFVGAGELISELKELAQHVERSTGIHVIFAGFVNQSKIHRFYLASDTLVLPSRRMGEAWGLVVNEALNAGCSVVATQAVGCTAEFRSLERFYVAKDDDVLDLAHGIGLFLKLPRSYTWAREFMRNYSTEAAAAHISAYLCGSVENKG